MLTSTLRCIATSLLLLLTCNAHIASALFTSSTSLQQLVHHWLHWGANLHSSDRAEPAHHPRALNNPDPPSTTNLPSYVIGAGDANGTQQNAIQYSSTMMHRPEIDLIVSYLRTNHVYLEFGAGGSTINFPPFVARAYSVEHNCAWANSLSTTLHERHPTKYANLHIKCVSVKPRQNSWGTLSKYEHANYKQFREYVDTVDTLPEETIDRVFIDGRARLACALKVLPRLNNESLVFIHDFYSRTKQYGAVLQYYTEVARVLAARNSDPAQGPIDEPQGIVVLRRKPNISYDLSAEDIDNIYDSIDWRFPFGQPLTSVGAYIRYYAGLATDPGQWARASNSDDLIRMLHYDVLRMAVLYVIVMAIFKYRSILRGHLPSRRDITTSERVPTRSASQPPKSEIRLTDTEGMRAASARRKRANSTGREV